MKAQATRDEPQQPENSSSEKLGCLGVLAIFVAMLGTVYATPYAIAWMFGAI